MEDRWGQGARALPRGDTRGPTAQLWSWLSLLGAPLKTFEAVTVGLPHS